MIMEIILKVKEKNGRRIKLNLIKGDRNMEKMI